MTNQIKHISELPKWFKLNKYKPEKELDTAGWYEQLYVRSNTKLALSYLKRNPNNKRFVDLVDDTFAKIQKNLLLTHSMTFN